MKNKNFFLIVGASKSGTTSLGSYLSQHPKILLPNRFNEPRFFVKDSILNISNLDPTRNYIIKNSVLNEEKYFSLFNNQNNSMYCCEDSIHYFNHPYESINKIKKYLGDIPIFIILRNPVDRMISNWKYLKKDLFPFDLSLIYENTRLEIGYNSFWGYKSQSIYFDKVKAFLDNFSNVKILIFEDFINNPKKQLSDCLSFLELDDFNFNTKKIFNKTGNNVYVKNKFLLKILDNPSFYKLFSNFIIDLKINQFKFLFNSKNDIIFDKKKLILPFNDDIKKLEKLLKRDLSSWSKKCH